ncbi:hypothetical protein GE061_004984 [Apolygus lucorum]|uniref:Carbonic anhydrase n=1 Tax=Apolygus lucorum TaxID=248454 RepID=A0A8S9WWQ4_APOLU|nr:hypothetical protein GE061_004984 [Apolygus lucorum]
MHVSPTFDYLQTSYLRICPSRQNKRRERTATPPTASIREKEAVAASKGSRSAVRGGFAEHDPLSVQSVPANRTARSSRRAHGGVNTSTTMSRATAISAFANLLLLPVTYSMIFHRGIPNFSYASGGDDWNDTSCVNGKMQSPIHITTVTAEYNPEAQPLVFINYDLASLEASVTPHTIKFDLKPQYVGPQIGIAGGGLIGFYLLNHIHLHWSRSEHSIDQNTYKMEAHLVHYKSPYNNMTQDEVLDEPDGIAVLAVLFELGTADPLIEDLIANLGRNLTEVELPMVTPQSFLPANTDVYIRYRGSLTTPPCDEVVIWTVFPTPKTLTQYQVTWLATRKLSEGIPDPNNYRNVQKRNNREIVFMKASYSYNVVPGGESLRSSSSYGAPSIVLLLTAILCFSLRSS